MTQRTILFRGKSIESGEWVEGYFGIKGEGTDLEKSFIMQSEINTKFSGYPFYFADIEVNPATVGQFTGLTDKNGVKIFEGDIVKCPTATEPEENGFIVVYKSYRLFFSNVNYPDLNTYGSDNWEYFSKYSEVIGNIHTK
jgi:uncharacterized phage protein (TIGR01671 family)